MLTIVQERERTRTRLKREMSSPDTVYGDNNDGQQNDSDIEEVRYIDRRAAKRARTRRQVAGGSEVIEIND